MPQLPRCLPDCIMERGAMLNVEIQDGVARVTLNRPELRNAFDDVLIRELQAAFTRLGSDKAVRVLVLAGNGPAFCAGADLNWMKRMAGYGYDENVADAQALATMLATLDRIPKPTIARVHGPVFAGGTGLVAACDIAVGTPEAKFCLSEAKLGLSPATISPYVIRAMGSAWRGVTSSPPRCSTRRRPTASACCRRSFLRRHLTRRLTAL